MIAMVTIEVTIAAAQVSEMIAVVPEAEVVMPIAGAEAVLVFEVIAVDSRAGEVGVVEVEGEVPSGVIEVISEAEVIAAEVEAEKGPEIVLALKEKGPEIVAVKAAETESAVRSTTFLFV